MDKDNFDIEYHLEIDPSDVSKLEKYANDTSRADDPSKDWVKTPDKSWTSIICSRVKPLGGYLKLYIKKLKKRGSSIPEEKDENREKDTTDLIYITVDDRNE